MSTARVDEIEKYSPKKQVFMIDRVKFQANIQSTLKEHDIILQIDGKVVCSIANLESSSHWEESVNFLILRSGIELAIKVFIIFNL